MLVWVLDVAGTRHPQVADVLCTGANLRVHAVRSADGEAGQFPLARLGQIDHDDRDLVLHFVVGPNEIELVALRCVDVERAGSLLQEVASSYRSATGRALDPSIVTNLPLPNGPFPL